VKKAEGKRTKIDAFSLAIYSFGTFARDLV
jgi:hypothetical protein